MSVIKTDVSCVSWPWSYGAFCGNILETIRQVIVSTHRNYEHVHRGSYDALQERWSITRVEARTRKVIVGLIKELRKDT